MADEMMDKDPALAQTGSAEAHITPADVHAAHDTGGVRAGVPEHVPYGGGRAAAFG